MKAKRRKAKGAAIESENVASATDCTGLMPALPGDEAEDKAEAALYGVHPAKSIRESYRAGK